MSAPAEVSAPAEHVEQPWPLVTEATHRFLAWPRYGDEGDLEQLLATWAECLASCESTCLCLRHDATFDGPLDAAIERLQSAWSQSVPDHIELEVLLVDGEMTSTELMRLGMSVEAVLAMPGCSDPARAAFTRAVGRPLLDSPMTV